MVVILLAEGFEESEAIVPLDLLRRGGVETVTCSITEEKTVVSAHNVPVVADITLSELDRDAVELVFVPGGMGGVNNIMSNTEALRLLTDAFRLHKKLAAICAGSTVLASLGVTDGRRAVVYPGMEREMGAAHLVTDPVAADGNVVTGEAAGSAFAFGLKLVELMKGAETAQQVRQSVHYHG